VSDLSISQTIIKDYRITGGAGTLGFEASKALLEHGLAGLMIFDVCNAIQAQPKIDALQKEFAAKIMFQEVDITDDVAVTKAVEETAKLLGACICLTELSKSFVDISSSCILKLNG
jgi:NAD(P)-dependent dehydrogenase (short-subunit alcohol dehydrogenase family)